MSSAVWLQRDIFNAIAAHWQSKVNSAVATGQPNANTETYLRGCRDMAAELALVFGLCAEEVAPANTVPKLTDVIR